MPLNTPERRDFKIQSNESKSRLFFSRVLESYHKAAASARTEIYQSYKIGGSQISLSFAGSDGVPLITPAFEHLRVKKKEKTGLKIFIWDSASTGVKLPPMPWSLKGSAHKKQPWRYSSRRFNVLSQPENNTLNIIDHHCHKAIFWIQDFKNLPQYEVGSPLLAILHWWFSRRDFQLIHGAAVGRKNGGILVVGKGGSGKSSTALSCLQSDLLYTGDDYCLVSSHKQPYVHSLYSTGKLNSRDAPLFPYLKSAECRFLNMKKQEKSIYFIHRGFPEKTLKKFLLKAVLIPELSRHHSPWFEKISPVSGLLALGPSTIFQLPGFEEQTFRNLSDVVKRVPCFKLHLARDRNKNALAVSEFLTLRSA